MVKLFTDRWKPKEKEESSIVEKIKNVGQPSDNLKEKITMATQRIDAQTRMLDAAVSRFQNRDREVFNRIVKAMANRDQARANILATELSEIRKVETMLSQASLGLQSVSMRLSTVSEMGDIVSVLSPAKGMLNSIRSEMCSIMPEASQELGNIGNLLTDICSQTSQSSDMQVNTTMASADALQILEEAEVAAENRLKDRLPEISVENHVQRRTSLEV
ncbi:MAG: Snf7 family protein [Candidatus Bathyarchaeia archaeon]